MRLRFAAVLMLLVFSMGACVARAQNAFYVTFSAQHVDSGNHGTFGSADHLDSGVWMFGPQFGITHGLWHAGPLHVAVDARGAILSRDTARLNNALGGVKVSLETHALPFRPYVQASAGVAGFNYDRRQDLVTTFQYELDGGVDSAIFPHVDWRVVEIGGGELTNNGGNSMFHINTGLQIRF